MASAAATSDSSAETELVNLSASGTCAEDGATAPVVVRRFEESISPPRTPVQSIRAAAVPVPQLPEDAATATAAAAPFRWRHSLYALDLCDTDEENPADMPALEGNEMSMWEQVRKKVWQLHPPRRVFGMARSNPIRAACIIVAASDWFNAITFIAILANAVFILANDPTVPDSGSGAPVRNGLDMKALTALNCVFTVEFAVKVLAGGLYGSQEAYLSKPWNWLDVGLLALGWAAGSSSAAQHLGALRILRILRGLTVFSGPHMVLAASFRSVKALVGVCSLGLLCVAAFALAGLALWRGVLAGNCAYVDPSTGSMTLVSGGVSCALPCDVSTGCAPTFGDVCDPVLLPGPNGTVLSADASCIPSLNPDWGQTSFDNFGLAMLTSFTFITTEGWSGTVYTIWHTWGQRWLVSLLSVTHVIMTAWVVLELCLAVIGNEYLRLHQEERVKRDSLMSFVRASRQQQTSGVTAEVRPSMMSALTGTLLRGLQQRRIMDRRRRASAISNPASPARPPQPAAGVQQPEQAESTWCTCVHQRCCSMARMQRGFIQRVVRFLLFDIMAWTTSARGSALTAMLQWWKRVVPPVPAHVAAACRAIEAHPVFAALSVILVLANGIALGCEYQGMSREYRARLAAANVACVAAFTAELIVRMLAHGARHYLSVPFQAFDAVVVVLSLVDVVMDASPVAYTQTGASVIRITRVIRLFRLARSWKGLQDALKDLLRALPQAANTVVVLFCMELSAAAVGMQMFGGNRYAAAVDAGILQAVPRLHFNDLWTALVAVFDVIDNENWNDQLHIHMAVFGAPAAIFFVVIILIGNYVFLNVMIAALVGAFEEQYMNQMLSTDEPMDDEAGIKAIGTALISRLKSFASLRLGASPSKDPSPSESPSARDQHAASPLSACSTARPPALVTIRVRARGEVPEVVATLPVSSPRTPTGADTNKEIRINAHGGIRVVEMAAVRGDGSQRSALSALSQRRFDDLSRQSDTSLRRLAISTASTDAADSDSTPTTATAPNPRCSPWIVACGTRVAASVLHSLRRMQLWCAQAVEHPWFEHGVMVTIVVSCLNLALDEPLLQRCSTSTCAVTTSYLKYADYAITALFTAEMCIQMVARGLLVAEVGYFRDWWRLLDFSMVVVSLLSTGVTSSSVRSLRAIRGIRALRPLRFAARLESLRLVISSLIASIPRVANVTLVIIVFMYMFAVSGLQSFGGLFNVCNDGSVSTQDACTDTFMLQGAACMMLPTDADANACMLNPDGVAFPRIWAPQGSNFDDIGVAMLTVFELATGENWPVLMTYAQDGTANGPVTNANPAAMLFYVLAQLVINQFLIELLASSIITMYTSMRSTMGDAALLTPSQREWVANMRVMMRTRPTVQLLPASYGVGVLDSAARTMHGWVTWPYFEALAGTLVLAHMIIIATIHVQLDGRWMTAYLAADTVFAALFALELLVKLFAQGWSELLHSHANLFHIIVSVLAVVNVCLQYTAPATVAAAVLRIAPIVRIFRISLSVPSQLTLLNVLTTRMPVFLNILGLMALDVFVFAVIAMNLYGGTRTSVSYTADAVFDNFGTAVFTLLRCSTGENWNMIMHDLTIAPPYCALGTDSNCGNTLVVVALYWTSFYAITGWMLVAMLTAALVDAFEDVSDSESALGVGLFRLTHARATQFTASWVAACDVDSQDRLLLPLDRVVAVIAVIPAPMGSSTEGGDPTVARAAAKRLLHSLPLIPNAAGELHFHAVLHALVERACALPPLGAVVGRISTGVGNVNAAYTLSQLHGVTLVQRWWRAHRGSFSRISALPGAAKAHPMVDATQTDDMSQHDVVTLTESITVLVVDAVPEPGEEETPSTADENGATESTEVPGA